MRHDSDIRHGRDILRALECVFREQHSPDAHHVSLVYGRMRHDRRLRRRERNVHVRLDGWRAHDESRLRFEHMSSDIRAPYGRDRGRHQRLRDKRDLAGYDILQHEV